MVAQVQTSSCLYVSETVHLEDVKKTQGSLHKNHVLLPDAAGHTTLGPLGLRANAPYEERLEGISAGIGVLAGPFWRLQIDRIQDEWVFLQLEMVRQGSIYSMKSLKMIYVSSKNH